MAGFIQTWQKEAYFGHDVDLVSDMIQLDARRMIELHHQIQALKKQMARVASDSVIARQLDTVPGFGLICTAELAGEIGTIDRFRNEASLALYLGMARSAQRLPGCAPSVAGSATHSTRWRRQPAHGTWWRWETWPGSCSRT